MSKRRITKQQQIRIKTKQQRYYQQSTNNQACADSSIAQELGLVIRSFGRKAEIETKSQQRILCSIRTHIETIVAGDTVIWQATEKDYGVILSCAPRQSVLTRPDKHKTAKPIAANISQMMIVVAPIPEISWLLLDSYLVMAETTGIKPCIILNKADLPHEAIYRELQRTYLPLGYTILTLSQLTPNSYPILEKKLAGETSVFVGQSGVGKSSIISTLLPHESIAIAPISDSAQLGCHTTTNSQYYHLPHGGALIDSPGIRSLHLGAISKEAILYGFKELKNLARKCKFSNCNHNATTPHCAVQQALAEHQVSQRRYDNLFYLFNKVSE